METQALAFLAAGLGAAGVTFGTAYGISKLAAMAMQGISRQPEAAGDIRGITIITAAMIEGVALLSAVICFILSARTTLRQQGIAGPPRGPTYRTTMASPGKMGSVSSDKIPSMAFSTESNTLARKVCCRRSLFSTTVCRVTAPLGARLPRKIVLAPSGQIG